MMSQSDQEAKVELLEEPKFTGLRFRQRRLEWHGVRKWGAKGFWAVTDQALFAGTNFLANILLARWLESAAYGAFATAYAVFLLLGTLHTALWTEPMLVYGSSRYREAFGAYQAILLRYHWRFGLAAFAVFLALGLGLGVVGQRELALSFLGLSLAAPLVLYMWLVRRGAYALLEPRLAALGGGLYLFLYLGLAVSLLRMGFLNPFTALLAMALAALLAAEGIRFRLKSGPDRSVDPSEIRALHWGYGRWAFLAGALSWVPANLPLVLLSALKGLAYGGEFRAAYNLYMPVLHFQTSLNALFFPFLAKLRHEKGSVAWRQVGKISLVHLVPATLYLPVAFWVDQVALLLYGPQYPQVAALFFWMLPIPFLAAFSNALEAWNRGAEQPRVVTMAYAGASLLTFLAGPGFIAVFGGMGAAVTLVLAKASLVLALYALRAR